MGSNATFEIKYRGLGSPEHREQHGPDTECLLSPAFAGFEGLTCLVELLIGLYRLSLSNRSLALCFQGVLLGSKQFALPGGRLRAGGGSGGLTLRCVPQPLGLRQSLLSAVGRLGWKADVQDGFDEVPIHALAVEA